MIFEPGFVKQLKSDFERVTYQFRESINRPMGLTEKMLTNLVVRTEDLTVYDPQDVPDYVTKIGSPVKNEFVEAATKHLENGSVAYCILAGGLGSRMGECKATTRIPGLGMSLLAAKLLNVPGTGPIWIMTSSNNNAHIRDHVNSLVLPNKDRIKFFVQYDAYTLTPDNRITVSYGIPETSPCGHGDLLPALQESGLLDNFMKDGEKYFPSGRWVFVSNVDNVLSTLDVDILSRHLSLERQITCEVAKRKPTDTGGIICYPSDSDLVQAVDLFKLAPGVDPNKFSWTNTNTMMFSTLVAQQRLNYTWHRVRKNIGPRMVIHYERLLQELTAHFDTGYLEVDRYMPIKTKEDLELASAVFDANKR